MKKLFLMVAFAGFAMAASAQTEPTASTKSTEEKKVQCAGTQKMCTEKEKAACVKSESKSAGCCASKKSSTAMAAKAEKADKKEVAPTQKR